MEYFPVNIILSFPRLTEENRSEKQTAFFSILVSFFGSRKTDTVLFCLFFVQARRENLWFQGQK
jgi:hypothetical protein